jgi:hypothetical protein
MASSAASPSAEKLRGPWLPAVVALVIALPLLLPPILPLADLGGLMGRYAIQLDAGRDARLAQWYSFTWQLIPNLGADVLVQALAPLMGLEPTVRAIAFAAAFLQALGILATSRAIHGRITPFAIVALPFVYAHSFLYGFLNFVLSLGLVWCSLALWVKMSREEQPRKRWLAFALIATIVWTCHLVGWGLLCIAAGSQEFVRQYERKGGLFAAAAASILPLTCFLVPWLVKFLTFAPPTGSGRSTGFFLLGDKLLKIARVFRDQWFSFDLVSVAVILGLLVWSWVSPWTRLNRGLMLAAAVTALAVIVVPSRLMGSFFADQRLLEPMFLFALLAIGFAPRAPAKLVPALFTAAILFAGARLAANAVSLWQLGTRSANDLAVLEAVPRGSQMVNFRAWRCPPPFPWAIDRRTHLGGYAIARRHAFSNDQWQVPGAQLLHIHNPAAGEFTHEDSEIAYETACQGQPGIVAKAAQVPPTIPYLWIVWDTAPKALAGWQPVARNGGSVLYRRRSDIAERVTASRN